MRAQQQMAEFMSNYATQEQGQIYALVNRAILHSVVENSEPKILNGRFSGDSKSLWRFRRRAMDSGSRFESKTRG